MNNAFMNGIVAYFTQRIPISTRRADARYEAEKEYLEHQLAAEHNQALADMYRERIKRIDRESAEKPSVEVVDPHVVGVLSTVRRHG